MYYLANVQDRARLAELSTSDKVKSLTEEVALIRMLFEKVWNSAKTDAELISMSAQLNHLALTSERLVKSCYTLEQNLGELLPRDEVIRFAQALCEIVIEELEGIEGYEAIIDRIVDRLFILVGGRPSQPEQLRLSLTQRYQEENTFPSLEDND